MAKQNNVLRDIIRREYDRLLNFIRYRVSDDTDAEDIAQDVFYLFVETYQMMKPVEQISAWLFRVARNKIIDRFRKKKAIPISTIENNMRSTENEPGNTLLDLLPDPGDNPEIAYLRSALLEELIEAIDELPEAQREVILQHDLEGLSFKEISEITGVPVNTLLSRKRYAILFLRERLRDIYEEFLEG